MDGGVLHLYHDPDIIFPSPVERSVSIQASDLRSCFPWKCRGGSCSRSLWRFGWCLWASGEHSATIKCRSWNCGRCIAPSRSCRFAHSCSTRAGDQRACVCRGLLNKTTDFYTSLLINSHCLTELLNSSGKKNYITLKPLEWFSIFEITSNKFRKSTSPQLLRSL